MTTPQSVSPSVAFEIPLERKGIKGSPPVQKRLEEAATTPRKSFSLQDIVKKLTDAGKRREDVVSKSKTLAHNANVKSIADSFAKRDADLELEKRIAAKLEDASARREDKTAGLVKKLSETNKDKIERGSKALNDAESFSRDLDETIHLKVKLAESRREELIGKKVKSLAIANDGKHQRGQLAIELSDNNARHKENQLSNKLLAATHRREMAGIFKNIQNTDLAADREDKVAELRFREEELALSRAIAIEEKLNSAEERRAKATAEAVQQLSKATEDKVARGMASIQEQQLKLKQADAESQKKIEQANQRRLKQMQEKQEASNLALAQKEAKKERQIDIEEAKLKVKEKALNSKILQANLRKEEMLLEKSTTLEANHTKKMERAIMAKKIELEESAALGKEVERKLKIASARKAKITNDTMKEMHDRHKNKVEKIEQMLSKQELKEMQQYIDIENKIASASAKRQEKLGEIAKSSSKKRVSSPKPSPNKSEIDARINKAAARREMYLLTKIDKATSSSSKKLSPRSDLFAKVTPRLGDNGSNGTISPRASPRIKAARLENYSDDKPYQHENVGGFSMMPVIAVSAIALAFVGIASFWKH